MRVMFQREPKRTPSFASRAVLIGMTALAALLACSADTLAARGGLMVTVSTDGDIAPNKLKIRVDGKNGTLFQNEIDLKTTTLPNNLSVVSNGDETATATITISAFKDDTPVARRDAIITQIPTAYVASLNVRLTASCAQYVESDGNGGARSTCPGEANTCIDGTCQPSTVDGSSLPPFNGGAADASTPDSPESDAALPHETLFAFVANDTNIFVYGAESSGPLTLKSLSETPAYHLAFHPASHRVAYAGAGAIGCLLFDPATGSLTSGSKPYARAFKSDSFLTFTPSGAHLIVAEATANHVGIHPIDPAGAISSPIDFTGPTSPSWVGLNRDETFLLVTSKTEDRIFSYTFQKSTGTAAPSGESSLPTGGHPRRMVFDAAETRAYVVNEDAVTLTVMNYDKASAKFTLYSNVSVSPSGTTGAKANDVVSHPNGKYLYTLVDGSTVLRLNVDSNGGASPSGTVATLTGAKGPGSLAISPDGAFLFVASKINNALARFSVDPTTGNLTPLAQVSVGSPNFVALVRFE